MRAKAPPASLAAVKGFAATFRVTRQKGNVA